MPGVTSSPCSAAREELALGSPRPDGDADGGEEVSPPQFAAGSGDPSGLLRKGRWEGPTIKTGEISKGLRTAEGWSDRRNTRGPKASSKSYLDQQSHQSPTEPARTGYRKHTSTR